MASDRREVTRRRGGPLVRYAMTTAADIEEQRTAEAPGTGEEQGSSMNRMSTFRPEPGVHVHDGLNDRWIELTPDHVAS